MVQPVTRPEDQTNWDERGNFNFIKDGSRKAI